MPGDELYKPIVITERPIQIVIEEAVLDGNLLLPTKMHGIILFAHGSRSNRLSPRNQLLARQLNRVGYGTLLMDLLSQDEQTVEKNSCTISFDMPLLAGRLAAAINWLGTDAATQGRPLGLCGASTGSAAAIIAAANLPKAVSAVVSRGGRPDLAGKYLTRVKAPTLLIVGGLDMQVFELNRLAQAQMRCRHKLELVPGASHLFEEPGTLQRAAELASNWFRTYVVARSDLRDSGFQHRGHHGYGHGYGFGMSPYR